MPRHLARSLFAVSLLLGLAGMAAGGMRGADGAREVVVLPTTGIVDNVMAGYLRDAVARAAEEGAAAVVVRLNTPGGSVEATNDIVGTLLEANVATVVWVSPSGGRAASAGTFITLAGHVALMAPGTSIGAASPVLSTGEDVPETLRDKVFNDLMAKMRAIAEERGRNVDWAVSTVEEAASASANEAVAVGAVDGIASSIDDVIEFAHGREVTVGGATITLDLEGAQARELPMNPFQAFLHLLSNPDIAALLFTIGSLGLIYELMSPNFVTGIIGALAIILAFIGSQALPLNVGGLLLIALAMLLFVLELSVVSHGLLTIGGLVCFALGASALYTEPGDLAAPDVSVGLPLVAAMTLSVAAFMVLALATVIRSRRQGTLLAATFGAGGSMVLPAGTPGEVRRPLTPTGSVYAAGEEWSARAVDERPLERGTPVRVVREEGLTLIVEPIDPVGSSA
ncbi:MAG TPA: NfeD family protein [Vitreimonas sp.]|nr:NfeD family protein [Vitreimonas sp.]